MPPISKIFLNFRKNIMKKILCLFIMLFCIIDTDFGQSVYPYRSDGVKAIMAFWYNCRPDTAVETAVHDTTFMHSTLQVYGPVPADSFQVMTEVYMPDGTRSYSESFHVRKDMKSTNFMTEVVKDHFRITVPVYHLDENPARIRVVISSADRKMEEWIDCKYHKLYGHFLDFMGHSLKSYILIRSDGFNTVSGVWSDSSGYYEIYLPERTYNCFYINDGNYKSTTLEAWAWHMIVDEDRNLDFKIGTGEVYNLSAWPSNGGPNSLLISFRPMVLFHNNLVDTMLKIGDKEYRIINIAPELDLKDIRITINGTQTELYTIQKYFESGRDMAMPAYIVQVRRLMPCFGKQTLMVEYEKTIEIGDKKVLQNSMGYFQYYPNFYGLSFFN